MNKIDLIKEHKEDSLAGLNALLDRLYSLKEFENEHEEIKEELKSKGDDTWRNYVLNMTKDIVKYEKLRRKIINDDFNFTTVEINDLAQVYFYLSCSWKKQIEMLEKAIIESDNMVKELTEVK